MGRSRRGGEDSVPQTSGWNLLGLLVQTRPSLGSQTLSQLDHPGLLGDMVPGLGPAASCESLVAAMGSYPRSQTQRPEGQHHLRAAPTVPRAVLGIQPVLSK